MTRDDATSTRTQNRFAAEAAPRSGWVLTIVHSPDTERAGTQVRVRSGAGVGRVEGDDVELVVRDGQISRSHAVFATTSGQLALTLEDRGSKNGTFVEGRRIHAERLVDGAVIRFGDTVCIAHQRDSAPDLDGAPDPLIVGHSRATRAIARAIAKVASTDLAVLIVGETGTGKELVARRVHELSGRAGPLVSVNCAAIPEQLVESTLFGHTKGAFTGATGDADGVFVAADGGTLFLDEIGELPEALQPTLLRALDTHTVMPVGTTTTRSVDTRVVAATNADLDAAVEAGSFRRDLHARLNEYQLALPPLRDRRSDIPLLFAHFVREADPSGAFSWTADFLEALLIYRWPANVRELRSLAKRLALVEDSRTFDGASLPSHMRPARNPTDPGDVPSKAELEAVLERFNGNLLRVSRHYGRARSQIYRWLKRYDVRPDDFRER